MSLQNNNCEINVSIFMKFVSHVSFRYFNFYYQLAVSINIVLPPFFDIRIDGLTDWGADCGLRSGPPEPFKITSNQLKNSLKTSLNRSPWPRNGVFKTKYCIKI